MAFIVSRRDCQVRALGEWECQDRESPYKQECEHYGYACPGCNPEKLVLPWDVHKDSKVYATEEQAEEAWLEMVFTAVSS